MKFIVYLLLFFTLSSILDAAYLRTIRVGTYFNPTDAQNALAKLKLFVEKNSSLKELQQSSNFQLKYRQSGKYYITLIEPFTQRATLQKTLDILRQEYKDVYVTKLKKISNLQEPDSIPLVDIQEKKPITPPISQPMTPLVPEKELLKPMEPQELTPLEPAVQTVRKPKIQTTLANNTKPINQIQKESDTIEPPATPLQTADSLNIWIYLFFFTLLLLILLSVLLFKLKKENERYQDKDLIKDEELNQMRITLKKNEEFLSHSSHELRTPMTAIMGLTHLALESELPKFQRDYIEKIQTSAEHLVHIINDILDISKMEAGKLTLENEEFNINDILDYILNIVSMKMNKEKLKVKLEVDNDVPAKIVGDSLRLEQILINLLGNSIKFTKVGEVKLHVKMISNFANTLTLEFIVSDTGIGMSEEQTQEIFNSYTQADKSTSRKFGGTGLGLSISKQLTEMMNGKIKVSSQKGVGTTFNITIPFQIKDEENQRNYRLPSKAFLNKRILIVDSSQYNTFSLVKAFSYFNYKCHVIPAFEDAVLEYAMHFHIIVIHENKLTKFAVKKINDLKKNAIGTTKVVLLNELHSNFNAETIKLIHIDAFFKTPFTQKSILSLIVELYSEANTESYSRKKTMKDKLMELSPKKVLVAEDNLLNHKVIAGLLANTPIKLTFVTDGVEAVQAVKEETHFDLILMDINMPRMSGYEAAAEIRKEKKNNATPILSLTADVMQEAIDKSFEAGMQGHIAKPIIVDIFYKKLFDTLHSPSVKIKQIHPDQNEQALSHEDLSISMGLNRCNNDEEFYKSILSDFTSLYVNSAHALEELCRSGEFKEARKKAMDIKDVSLNIGAYNLCESAASMEYEFEKGARSNWQELISLYAVNLKKVLIEIEKYDKNV